MYIYITNKTFTFADFRDCLSLSLAFSLVKVRAVYVCPEKEKENKIKPPGLCVRGRRISRK